MATTCGSERDRLKGDGGESYSVLRWETTSRLVNPACRKFCSYRSIFMARSHSETEPQADRGGGTRWSSRGWEGLSDRKSGGRNVNSAAPAL